MHVFVSYSRGDAAFVSRLVAVLEGDGHDVWVDTDDIRGSEEWRASIVRGIRQSDVVVLVVSSRSMASEEVAREVTVAAQENRRIVPLILEQVAL
ncbi:MAG TPA: toll/interleukin-1 receptor domain-containing protein, partial [Acidimicrobiales bacterium]|nr:toll/interleukin-1 receptor domain-containing protein [Acidimicrobiales bacterium]